MESIVDVPQNVLESCKMRVPWIVHMQADYLNNVGDVWSGEGEIL